MAKQRTRNLENFSKGAAGEVEQVDINKLIPYARNAKQHSDSQVASIAGSLKQFGFNNPVLIDQDGGIIAGHGRVLAARKLELETVPCIRLEHLTENEKRAYILADNRLQEQGGGWDDDVLKLELDDINFEEFEDFKLDDLDFNFMEDVPPQNGGQESSTREVDPENFTMECTCPKCGFEFDPK